MLYIWFLLIHFHFPQLLLLLPLFIRPPFFVQISRLNSVAGYIAEHRKHFSCCFRLGWMVNGRRGLHNCECDWRKMQRRRKKKRGTIWHVIIGKRERIRTPKWTDNDPIDTQALYTRFYASVLFTIRVYIAIELASFISPPTTALDSGSTASGKSCAHSRPLQFLWTLYIWIGPSVGFFLCYNAPGKGHSCRLLCRSVIALGV